LIVSLLTWSFLALASASLRGTLLTIAPFYLGSYFLTQQMMQVRQGLAMALVFYVILDCEKRQIGVKHAALTMAALGIHLVSALPITAALLWRLGPPWRRHGDLSWGCAGLLIAAAFAAAKLTAHIEVFSALKRLSLYASDNEFNGTRGYLTPANLRAGALLFLVLLVRVPESWRRAYGTLAALYAVHLGLRIGFNDFEIMSGRLASALGFAEVFLLALAVRYGIRSKALRYTAAALFLIAQGFATIAIQVPYLIHDYLTAIHSYNISY
jgi:hypothetical protein